MTDYISRADAVKTVIRKCSPICAWQVGTQQYPDCVVAEINALPPAELTLQTPQTYGKSINPSNAEVVADYISRADAIEAVRGLSVLVDDEDFSYFEEALEALPSADTSSDLISRADALALFYPDTQYWGDDIDNKLLSLPSAGYSKQRQTTLNGDLVSRADAIEEISKGVWNEQELIDRIKALPSNAVDCTDFIEWLVEVVLDDEDWELNAVAYGEIICRKLEKLGVLETTEEPSYYIRPSADRPQGVWINREYCQVDEDAYEVATCSNCKSEITIEYPHDNYCPNCGADMRGGAE